MCNKVKIKKKKTNSHILIRTLVESRMMGNYHVRFGNESLLDIRHSRIHP